MLGSVNVASKLMTPAKEVAVINYKKKKNRLQLKITQRTQGKM